MTKNINKIINFILLAIGILLFIISTYFFITSFSFYKDEYGTDISFDEYYFVLLLIFLSISIFSSIELVAIYKNNYNIKYFFIFYMILSLFIATYSLGYLFKLLNKDELFNDIYIYLIISIISIMILIILAVIYKKKYYKKA